MRKLITHGVIQVNQTRYLNLILLIAPMLNLLSGLTLTLYTASLPAMADYFHSSIIVTKNLVSISLIGFAVGCIIFGVALDILGRRRIILLALIIYLFASLLALRAGSIQEIIMICFIQSVMSASVSIGPRALISDHFTGPQFQIGLLYTSLAYGVGSIIGPFMGALLQYHFGWQANFVAYALSAGVLLLLFALYINESLMVQPQFSFAAIAANHFAMLKHTAFMLGILISGIVQFQLTVYPAVGAFVVENLLHRTTLAYGNSALFISLGYMLGTLANRLVIKRFALAHLIAFGLMLLAIAVITQLGFAAFGIFNLVTLTLPIMLISFSTAFIFMNVVGPCIKLFPKNTGTAMAVLTCLAMVLAALGIFAISHIEVKNLMTISLFFAVPTLVQIGLYFKFKKYLR